MIFGANNSITTYRLADAGDVTSYGGTPIISGAEAYIESPSPELLAVLGDQGGVELFLCHVEPGDYRITDKLIDNQSREYRIVAIERHQNNEDTDDIYTLRIHSETQQYNG